MVRSREGGSLKRGAAGLLRQGLLTEQSSRQNVGGGGALPGKHLRLEAKACSFCP